MFLEEIIKSVQIESDKFEGKAKLNRDDVVGWLKTISGFANAFGGDFFIGVEDKTNKLIGFDRIEANNERNYFNAQVNEHLVPRPQMSISYIRYESNKEERFIIHVHVRNSVVKPIILKYENVPSIYMRRDGFTDGATYEEIIDMCVNNQSIYHNSVTSELRLAYIPVAKGTDFDDKVLTFCFGNEHKVSEIAAYLEISDSTYLRKKC